MAYNDRQTAGWSCRPGLGDRLRTGVRRTAVRFRVRRLDVQELADVQRRLGEQGGGQMGADLYPAGDGFDERHDVAIER